MKKLLTKLFLAMLLVTSIHAEGVGPRDDAEVECDHINSSSADELSVATCGDAESGLRPCPTDGDPDSISE